MIQKPATKGTLYFAVIVIWMVWQLFQFSAHQVIATDELTYVHGGWATAQGLSYYRDFFFHHFPGILELCAVPFIFGNSGVDGFLVLRGVMLWVMLLAIFAGSHLNKRFGPTSVLVTAVFMIAVEPFRTAELEIRPDSLAFGIFLISIAMVERRVMFIAGMLGAAAIWSSEKSLIYGFPWWILVLVGSIRNPEYRRYLLGASAVIILLLLRLLHTGVIESWINLTFWWQLVHENHYPPREAAPFYRWLFAGYWWLMLSGAIGVFATIKRARLQNDHKEIALAVMVVTAALSFGIQRAPLQYSAVPFLGLCAIFAARGIGELVRVLGPELRGSFIRQPPSRCDFMLAGILAFTVVGCPLAQVSIPRNNRDQLRFIGAVEELAQVDEPIYDNTGWGIARPHTNYLYFTDKVVRRVLATTLTEEIPRAIQQADVRLMIVDRRFSDLPEPLRTWLFGYFNEVVAVENGKDPKVPEIRRHSVDSESAR